MARPKRRRNTYAKWLYRDKYGQQQLAFTRAEARQLDQSKHRYALEYVRRVRPMEYFQSVAEVRATPSHGLGKVYPRDYFNPNAYSRGFINTRIKDPEIREFVRYQQSILVPMFLTALEAGEDVALYYQLRDAVNEVARHGFGQAWFDLAKRVNGDSMFQNRYAETHHDLLAQGQGWFYWAKSNPNYEPPTYMDVWDDIDYEALMEGEV